MNLYIYVMSMIAGASFATWQENYSAGIFITASLLAIALMLDKRGYDW